MVNNDPFHGLILGYLQYSACATIHGVVEVIPTSRDDIKAYLNGEEITLDKYDKIKECYIELPRQFIITWNK